MAEVDPKTSAEIVKANIRGNLIWTVFATDSEAARDWRPAQQS